MKHFIELIEDFLRAYFDKLLLTAILLLLVWVGANSSVDTVKDWAMGQANTVIGAIIMLTTGKVLSRLTGNGNGHAKPEDKIEKKDGAII